MIEITGELFKSNTYSPIVEKPDVVCITTNGYTKTDGMAVLGKGYAREAVSIDRELPRILGRKLINKGNFPHILRNREGRAALVSFPVRPIDVLIEDKEDLNKLIPSMRKEENVGKNMPGWASLADIQIIKVSCMLLVSMSNEFKWNKVIIPRPGCINGGLEWENVRAEIEKILDDRFFIISYPERY